LKSATSDEIVAHGRACGSREFDRREALREGVRLYYIYRCLKCSWVLEEHVVAFEENVAA
jgi:hypothetical protein